MKEKKEQASIRELKQKEILSLEEVSRLYGLRKSWLYSLVHTKRIPYYKVPGSNLTFFRQDEVRNFVLAGRVAPVTETQEIGGNYGLQCR